MFRARWIVAAVMALPVAEIMVFIVVAAQLGLLATLALMGLTSLAGIALLRRAGPTRIAQFRGTTDDGILRTASVGGLPMILAGLLLTIPGFLTDVAGALVLIPTTRRWLLSQAAERAGLGPSSQVIDLAPEEWRRLPEQEPGRDPPRRRRA